jgi:broad specificity phosphatase PhoE
MKKLYLVRHGESEGNAGLFKQDSTSPLSKNGEKQIESVTERFKNILIDKIIASPQVRAKQTAEAIYKILNKSIEFSDLLIERKIPSLLIGKLRNDPVCEETDEQIYSHFHDIEWKHSDEENFSDLKKRAIKLFKYIDTLKEENILLVTHGVFMKMVVAYALLGEDLTSQEFWNFFIKLEISNTGITVLKQTQYKKEKIRWNILTWNDHAHLG